MDAARRVGNAGGGPFFFLDFGTSLDAVPRGGGSSPARGGDAVPRRSTDGRRGRLGGAAGRPDRAACSGAAAGPFVGERLGLLGGAAGRPGRPGRDGRVGRVGRGGRDGRGGLLEPPADFGASRLTMVGPPELATDPFSARSKSCCSSLEISRFREAQSSKFSFLMATLIAPRLASISAWRLRSFSSESSSALISSRSVAQDENLSSRMSLFMSACFSLSAASILHLWTTLARSTGSRRCGSCCVLQW